MLELWDKAIASIQQHVKSQNFDIWLQPIECESIGEQDITLRVPNRFFRDYLVANYLETIKKQLWDITQRDYEVLFSIDEAQGPGDGESKVTNRDVPPARAKSEQSPRPAPPAPEPAGDQENHGIVLGHLNARYRFDTFVVGPSNQLAHAGCMAVASMAGRKYNPLFIYGGVGLGKTHLVHAVGRQINESHPEKNIYYVSSEQFMNEFITCVRTQKQHEFQKKYRQNCDVLLMDDIQFIAGKDRTQDEFFHTFNSLYDQHKQIVVTCDKYPQEIDNLEERLRSRFQWGLIADIQAPELETRVAIVKRKADDEKIPLPDNVAFFLAENIRSNVRELEGSLIRLAAQASIENRAIDLDFARHVLRSVFNLSAPRSSVEDVQRAVCTYYNIRLGELKGKSRQHSVTLPRMVGMYLCRAGLGSSFPEIGERFGGRDHTTVINACRKIERVLEADLAVRSAVDTLRRKLAI
jgi:chromosomal replication initiator protein